MELTQKQQKKVIQAYRYWMRMNRQALFEKVQKRQPETMLSAKSTKFELVQALFFLTFGVKLKGELNLPKRHQRKTYLCCQCLDPVLLFPWEVMDRGQVWCEKCKEKYESIDPDLRAIEFGEYKHD